MTYYMLKVCAIVFFVVGFTFWTLKGLATPEVYTAEQLALKTETETYVQALQAYSSSMLQGAPTIQQLEQYTGLKRSSYFTALSGTYTVKSDYGAVRYHRQGIMMHSPVGRCWGTVKGARSKWKASRVECVWN